MSESDNLLVQFVTSPGNICPLCDDLDGSVWEADDPDKPDLPIHPNCECEYADYSGSQSADERYPDPELVSDWESQRVVAKGESEKDEPDEVYAQKIDDLNAELEDLAASIREKSTNKRKRG